MDYVKMYQGNMQRRGTSSIMFQKEPYEIKVE